MSWCERITDAGLAHLTGIHTLFVYGCYFAVVAAAHKRALAPRRRAGSQLTRIGYDSLDTNHNANTRRPLK